MPKAWYPVCGSCATADESARHHGTVMQELTLLGPSPAQRVQNSELVCGARIARTSSLADQSPKYSSLLPILTLCFFPPSDGSHSPSQAPFSTDLMSGWPTLTHEPRLTLRFEEERIVVEVVLDKSHPASILLA